MSTTPDTPSPIDGSGSLIHSSAGPPLILVFLGTGLFVGAVISILVLRRIYPSMRFVNPARSRLAVTEPVLNQKPLLWDVYVGRPDSSCSSSIWSRRGGDMGSARTYDWPEMMPLSARFLPSPQTLINRVSPSTSTTQPTLSAQTSSLLNGLCHTLFGSRTASPSDRKNIQLLSEHLAVEDQPPLGRLQVAVLISMPYPSHGRSNSHERCMEKASFPEQVLMEDQSWEYCVGLAEVPVVLRFSVDGGSVG